MPIVRFRRVRQMVHWDVIGYEALVRGPENTHFRCPDGLFRLADSLGVKDQLELWCVEHTLSLVPQLPEDSSVFINVSAHTMVSPTFRHLLRSHAVRIDARRVVFEILEGPISSLTELRATLDACSALGYRFAIDDIGAKGSSLSRMVQIGPVQFLKIDRSFLMQRWEREPERARAWLELIRRTAEDTGAQIVVEGIEERFLDCLTELHGLGISLGQGYLFGQAARLAGYEREDVRLMAGM